MSETAWLVGPRPDGRPGRWALDKDEYLIGRQAPADLVAPLPRVSRQHARISRREFGYYLIDLGSRNGTFVNGQPIGSEPHRLHDGDEIVLGGAIMFRFYDPSETMEGPSLGRLTGVWIDEETHAVWVDAQLVEPPLSPAQFTLLALLYRSAGQVVSRPEIIATVWPDVDPSGVSTEAVNGLIKRLRKRLRETPIHSEPDELPRQEYIEVLRGHGLRLVQPTE
ncbi:MAG: FHA domain-containing protein [Anaerolineae bacterium]